MASRSHLPEGGAASPGSTTGEPHTCVDGCVLGHYGPDSKRPVRCACSSPIATARRRVAQQNDPRASKGAKHRGTKRDGCPRGRNVCEIREERRRATRLIATMESRGQAMPPVSSAERPGVNQRARGGGPGGLSGRSQSTGQWLLSMEPERCSSRSGARLIGDVARRFLWLESK